VLRSIGATAVGFSGDIWRFGPAQPARIVLICPRCGHEMSENIETLRGTTFYNCRGDDCAYSFAIVARIGNDSTPARE